MFEDDFLKNLPDDPAEAAHLICTEVIKFDKQVPTDNEVKQYDNYLKGLGTFQAFSEIYGLNFEFPELGGNKENNIQVIQEFFKNAESNLNAKVTKLTVQKFRDDFLLKLDRGFAYEFSEGDLSKL